MVLLGSPFNRTFVICTYSVEVFKMGGPVDESVKKKICM